MTFRGLTWDHPRGYAALERASLEDGGLITWSRQPLEGFESKPIEEVCEGYDLVVLDHPHLGDALAARCLRSMDEILSSAALAAIRERSLRSAFDSYVMDNRSWALPLDAAAQVSAGRTDLMSTAWPTTFADLEEAASIERGFTMSLAGPHALSSLLSLCGAANRLFGPVEGDYLLGHHEEAIELFLALGKHSREEGYLANPITILQLMSEGALTFCPLIFGYVPYSSASARHPVIFRDAPRWRADSAPCGILGGTGIAITKSCAPDDRLVAHLETLMSDRVQVSHFPKNSGQPSSEAAWLDPQVNNDANDFYLGTIETLRHALLRPRHKGFVPAANRTSEWLRGALQAKGTTPERLRVAVNNLLRGGLKNG